MTAQDKPVLSLSHLAIPGERLVLPRYEVAALDVGILHVGIGAFHRAHQCTYFERLANLGETGCGVFGVSLKSAGVHEALERQDHLYTLTTLSPETPIQVMGCLRQSAGPDELGRALTLFESERLKMVTLTVTEKAYRDSDSAMVRFLVQGLRLRARSDLPLVIVSCDNLVGNGRRLKQLIIENLDEEVGLRRWVDAMVSFPNSMVDSITPRVSDDLLRSVERSIGVVDQIPVQRESFLQWVLEDCELPFDLSAAGVELVPDVAPYELLKLRVLNASHCLMAYAGSLLGHTTIAEAASDKRLHVIVQRFMGAMVSQMDLPSTIDAVAYIETTLARFRNPAVQHLLLQVAEDGSSKLKERVVPALVPPADSQSALICLPIVFWIEFVRLRLEQDIEIVDPMNSELVAATEQELIARSLALLGVSLQGVDELIGGLVEKLQRNGIESFIGELV